MWKWVTAIWFGRIDSGVHQICLTPNSATYLLAMWPWSLYMNDVMQLHGIKYLIMSLIPKYLLTVPVSPWNSRIIHSNVHITSPLDCWISIWNLLTAPSSQNQRHHYLPSCSREKSQAYSWVLSFSYPLTSTSKSSETKPPKYVLNTTTDLSPLLSPSLSHHQFSPTTLKQPPNVLLLLLILHIIVKERFF